MLCDITWAGAEKSEHCVWRFSVSCREIFILFIPCFISN